MPAESGFEDVFQSLSPDEAQQVYAEFLRRLPPDKRQRWNELFQSHDGIPFERMPEAVQREILDIFRNGFDVNILSDQQKHRIREATRRGEPHHGQRQTDAPRASEKHGGDCAILGTDVTSNRDVTITQEDRRQGLYIIGTTGTGKSTLITNLILTDIEQGLGVGLIEPKGTLTHSVIARIPERRLRDVILLDLEESDYPFGLNLFECQNPQDKIAPDKTASQVMHVFEKVWGVGTQMPRLAMVLRHVTNTLIENPGTTFAEIPLLFDEETVRQKLLRNLINDETRAFWEAYNRRSQRDRNELVESTRNKVDAYLANRTIRNIVSQSRSTIDFRAVMDERKILLVLLSPTLEEMSRLIGSMVIAKIMMAAFSRKDTQEDDRRQFNLYCDEFQRFATPDFAEFIDVAAREFRCPVTIANQSLSQLDEINQSAVIRVGSRVVFRVSGDDGKDLARNFDTTPTQQIIGEEPDRAVTSDPIGHLLTRGHTNPMVAMFSNGWLTQLELLVHRAASTSHPLVFGCCELAPKCVEQGKQALNATLYRCMFERRADVDIHAMALLVLGCIIDEQTTYVFQDYMSYAEVPPGSGFPACDSLTVGAKKLGTIDLLDEPRGSAREWLKKRATTSFLDRFNPDRVAARADAFLKILRALREVMKVLAREPIMVDTGQYKPKYQQRTYADMENEIANFLSTQPNFQAKVKLHSGQEHLIRTKSAPQGLSGSRLAVRINDIKEDMRRDDYCRDYREVAREIQERHERLRTDAGSKNPPSTHTEPPKSSPDEIGWSDAMIQCERCAEMVKLREFFAHWDKCRSLTPSSSERNAAESKSPPPIHTEPSRQQTPSPGHMAREREEPPPSHFTPGKNREATMTPRIPGIELISLNFFESGHSFIERKGRQYATSFPQQTTRSVIFEVTLRNMLPGKGDQTHHVTWVYLFNGSVLDKAEDDWVIKSESDVNWFTDGIGAAEPGHWTRGAYGVVILIDEREFAKGSFTIE